MDINLIEFEVGDRVRPISTTAQWRDEKMIIDRVYDDGILRLDIRVYFRTGGVFLMQGVSAHWYEHWKSRKSLRNGSAHIRRKRRQTRLKLT
jgi:hypothetical protein